MSTPAASWDSQQYLRFEEERTQPCRDLVGRISSRAPAGIVDLGCGPGNSTAVLAQRWPGSRLLGVDSSPEMLERARAGPVPAEWVLADLTEWQPRGPVDLVFSNAALQWIPGHPALIRRLWSWVAPGGAMAFQVPARGSPPPDWIRALDSLRRRPRWRGRVGGDPTESSVLPPGEYYDLLAPDARRVDVWETEYHHVLDDPEAVVEWLRGTVLRPTLARLSDEGERAQFLSALTEEVARAYRRRIDGKVLFPFLRRFVVAYR